MPPDLSQTARPLAASPHKSCEDADTRSPPPSPGTADHASISNGGGLQPALESPTSSRTGQVGSETGAEAGVGTKGTNSSVPPVVNTYRLTPKLRYAFASVGATDSAYSFREVLLLLKKYLFKGRLFDPNDRLYVNCESDPLGLALGVKRFHFNDVRTLISQNIIKVQSASGQVQSASGHTSLQEPPPVPDTLSSSNSSRLCSDGSNDSTCRLSVPLGAAPCIPVNGPASVATSPVPGPSRVCGRERALPGQSNPPPVIDCPDIPESCSDTETIYSVQGYETEYCRNTEFESSEEEDMVNVDSEVLEEYELPSDDARDENQQFSDSDSEIDDVGIAVLAYTLVQEELEDGFWADDDSDTDEENTEEEDLDPECVSDRWDCLTCGLKNKPFVRYCGKCWQLRKNWLPDRPKKRKRKPRPKKRNLTRRMASGPSEEQPTSQGTSSGDDHKAGHVSESSTDDSSQAVEMPRTFSASTTASRSSTQDSGFASSQDLFGSQELTEELVKDPRSDERTLMQPSTSREASQAEKQSVEDTVQPKMLSSRKRKSSITEDSTDSKRLKCLEDKDEVPFGDREMLVKDVLNFISSSSGKAWLTSPDGSKFVRSLQLSPLYQERLEEKDEVPFGDKEMLAKEMFNFISSSSGKTWLTTPDGTKFMRSLQLSPFCQELLTKMIAEQTSASSPGSSSGISTLCSICCLRPKNAAIIHGRLAHQATCYQCARRLLNEGARCPVCRRKIHMVCKLIVT